MQIKINNQDTENITIDTYNMFNGESFEESECEYLQEQNPGTTYSSYNWEYDHKAIVKDLAAASIQTILDAIAHTEYAKIITSIDYISSTSPKYYNYTSDSYIATYTVNESELTDYIEKNHDAVIAIASKYDDTICNNYTISLESMQHAAICHILNNCMTADDYNANMWECEREIYSNNLTVELIK